MICVHAAVVRSLKGVTAVKNAPELLIETG